MKSLECVLLEFCDWFAKATANYERDDMPCPDGSWVGKFLQERTCVRETTYWICSALPSSVDVKHLQSLGVKVGPFDPDDNIYHNCTVEDFDKLEPFWMARYLWGPED